MNASTRTLENAKTTAGGCCGAPVVLSPTELKDVKKMVQEHYGRAVQKPQAGCCQKTPGNDLSIPQLAGYREEVLAAIPAGAAEKSFGCGDPLAFAGVQPGQTVLDLGSGAGIDCFIAAQKVGPNGRVIGLDMTPEMIKAAQRNALQGGYTNVEFRLGDAEDMPIADGSVDWVISNCVINLSPDKPKVFQEIARVLKPGGRISISDLVAEDLPEFVQQDSGSYCGCIGGAIPEADYLQGLAQAGLMEVKAEARLQYSPEMIRGFILANEELNAKYGAFVDTNPELLERIKIASIKVVGRKPALDEKVAATVRAARQDDYPAIAGLLASSGLPANGFEKALPEAVVAENNGQFVGVFAMERYGADGLLRSYAVAPGWRGHGVGRQLWETLLRSAAASGVKKLYLLTNTIAELATRAGFKAIAREDVPQAMRDSTEFGLDCCSNAVTMKLELA